MAEVFVSYSLEDQGVAQSIMAAIERAGFAVFREHPAHSSDPEQVREQFQSAPCVVWLWSRSAARSASTKEEIHDAIHAWSEGRLVLATIDNAALPVGLRDLQGIPVRKDLDGLDLAELLAEVRALVDQARTRPPAPVSAQPTAAARSPVSRPRSSATVPLIAVALLLGAGGLAWMMMSLGQGPQDQLRDKGRLTQPGAPRPQPDELAPLPPVAQPPKQSAEAPPPQAAPRPPTAAPPQAAPPPGGGKGPPAPTSAPDGSPAAPQPAPAPPLGQQSVPSDGLMFIAMMLLAGIAIGAGSVWAWLKWGRRRPEPTLAIVPASLAPAIRASTTAPTHQVFVSYSRQDGSAVDELVKHIEKAGYTVWIDRHSTGSQRYAAPIVRAIKTSQLVALMCSQNAFGSDHVIREVYVAGDYKKPFIAFQLDQSEFPDDVLYFVSGFPRVRTDALDIQQLRSEIARLVAA